MLYRLGMEKIMEESAKRLYAIAAQHQNKDKINQAELAREFNVSSQSVNNWEKRGVPHSIAVEAEEKFGVSPSWIIKGIELDRELIVYSDKNTRSGYIRLDYLDIQSAAGHGKVADAYPPLIQNLNVLEDWALQSFGKNAVEKIKIINNSGDSMSPTIQDGDILFVDVSRRAFEAEGIYVLDWNGRLLTKRLVAQQDGRLAIISDNPSYHPEYINEKNIDSLVICGQVRGWWSFKRF